MSMILSMQTGSGKLLFLSGHGCEGDDQKTPIVIGHVGEDVSIEDGRKAARRCAQRMLDALEKELGSLDRIDHIVCARGFVNSASHFYRQPEVMNGFSEYLIEQLGERGQHARTAIGVNVLPNNQAVEVEMIVQVREE